MRPARMACKSMTEVTGEPLTAVMSSPTQILDEIGSGRPDVDDITELRGVLYGLHAVLRLPTAQEEESYLSLADASGVVEATT
jgi:hypothetical protein